MLPPENDNEMDDLIKAAGNNYQPAGGQPDWQQMRILLDKEMPEKKNPRRWLFMLLVPALLLTGVILVYLSNRNEPAKTMIPRQTAVSGKHMVKTALPALVNKPVKNAAVKNNSATSLPTQHIIEIRPDLSKRNGAAETGSFSPAGISSSNNHALQKWRKPFLQGHLLTQSQNESITGKPGLLRNNFRGKTSAVIRQAGLPDNEPIADPQLFAVSENTNNSIPAAIDSGKIPSKNGSAAFDNKPAAKPLSTPADITENKIIPATKAAVTKAKKENKKTNRPFEISLLYAPELTTIGFSYVDKPGSNFGLILGYKIFKNITLQTGVIQSRKNYTATGKDFTLRRPLPYNNKLNKVEGYCNMYEIPLNIKSQISRGKKYNLFYTAGVSSYFMKKEAYDYYYSTTGGDSSRYATFDTQSNYWFALATVGLGLEKRLSPDFTLSAMPFVKIPFRGMGRGNLQLLSTGINVLLTYHPSFKK